MESNNILILVLLNILNKGQHTGLNIEFLFFLHCIHVYVDISVNVTLEFQHL